MAEKIEIPGWAKFVGIFGIILGLCGMFGGVYDLMTPSMLTIQSQMMESMREVVKNAEKNRQEKTECSGDENTRQDRLAVDPTVMFQSMNSLMEVPTWFKEWSISKGIARLLISAGLVLSSVFLLIGKRGAPTIFFAVSILDFLRGIITMIVGGMSGSIILWWSVGTTAVGFFLLLILVIVVVVSDRSVYFPGKSTP